jgi:hypothetical protein
MMWRCFDHWMYNTTILWSTVEWHLALYNLQLDAYHCPSTGLWVVTLFRILWHHKCGTWYIYSTWWNVLSCSFEIRGYRYKKAATFRLRRKSMFDIRGCIRKFSDWVDNEMYAYLWYYWKATQRVMAANLTRVSHKIAIQLHLVEESCAVCISRSRRPQMRGTCTILRMAEKRNAYKILTSKSEGRRPRPEQCRSGCGGEEKNFQHLPGIEPRSSSS